MLRTEAHMLLYDIRVKLFIFGAIQLSVFKNQGRLLEEERQMLLVW
jgi:hypothetical protein